jgi:hypothetical protein
MGKALDYLKISVIAAIILAIIVFYVVRVLEPAIIIFFVSIIGLMFYFSSYTCSECGNWMALDVINTRLLDTDSSHDHFTQQEEVGVSVHRNSYGEVIGESSHIMNVNYVTTKTTKTYEKTYKCKYCGAISNRQFVNRSHETHRT